METFGFHLYRSTDGSLNNAVRITPDMIFGQGTGGGDYSFVDQQGITAGTTYYYWLAETEQNGRVNLHGPIRITAIEGYRPANMSG